MSAEPALSPASRQEPAARLSRTDVRELVARAVASVVGLELVVPLRKEAIRRAGGDDGLAVTVSADRVEVRVMAHRLPLPPLVQQAGDQVRDALDGTSWAGVPVRLLVTGLSHRALDDR